MRLEDWQKWLETQFIDPATVATPAEAPDDAESVPATPEEIADVVVAHQSATPESVPKYEASAPVVSPASEPAPVQPAPAAHSAPPPATNGLVDDVDVPSIERYLPFLRGVATPESEPPAPASTSSTAPIEQEAAPIAEVVNAEPRPLVEPPEPASEPEPPAHDAELIQPAISNQAVPEPHPSVAADAEEPAHRLVRRATLHHRTRPAKHTDSAAIAEDLSNGGLWDLVPKHIQTLVSLGSDDVAQNSYKREFKESRIELVGRLLDPTLSLEETARLLNVCPTTVRRYTNRGLLTHQRTQGDQRRFKLSDVLSFLESQSRTPSGRG